MGTDADADADDPAAIAAWIHEYRIACAWLGVEPLSPPALAQLVADELGITLTLQ